MPANTLTPVLRKVPNVELGSLFLSSWKLDKNTFVCAGISD